MSKKPRRRTRNEEEAEWGARPAEDEDISSKKPRSFAKKKLALVLGYAGTGYSGLQVNPNVETIEKTLEEAIFQAGGISEDNHKDLQKLKWARAARTDKGVHALGNVVSLKINPETTVDQINEKLPNDIRVFGIVKVTKSFNAKVMCSSRKYCYVLPSYALAGDIASLKSDQLDCFQVQRTHIDQLNEILERFQGTFNFHNFTIRRQATDKSCMRYMRVVRVSDTFKYGDLEFIRIGIHGDSFMIYQIRKMIGSALAVYHRRIPKDELSGEALLSKDRKASMPVVPGAGLYLDQCIFDTYNTKVEKLQGNQGVREELQIEHYERIRQQFFKDTILRDICQREGYQRVSRMGIEFDWKVGVERRSL